MKTCVGVDAHPPWRLRMCVPKMGGKLVTVERLKYACVGSDKADKWQTQGMDGIMMNMIGASETRRGIGHSLKSTCDVSKVRSCSTGAQTRVYSLISSLTFSLLGLPGRTHLRASPV